MIIIHDFFKYYGGGERLVIELSKYFKENIYTSFKGKNFNQYNNIIINKKFNWLFSISKYLFVSIFFILFMKLNNTDKNKVILYSGNFSILSILRLKKFGTKHILYIHSLPKRIFYNQYNIEVTFIESVFYRLLRIIFIFTYNKIYSNLDLIIFNSKFTQKNFTKYFNLNIKTEILYPFFDEKKFNINNVNYNNYFVFNSRHEKNKRIIDVLDFFSKNNNFNLYVTNNGSLTNYLLKKYSNFNNIFFKQLLSNEEYINILKNSKGVIMVPKKEDFGMSAIESFACGKIVLASKEGGLVEIFPQNYKYYINTDKFDESLKDNILLINDNYTNTYFDEKYLSNFNFKNFSNQIKKLIY